MDFSAAKQFALESFFALHPREHLPEWVERCVTIGGRRASGSWLIELTVNPRVRLKEGEFWEMRNGRKVLAKIDVCSGQKRIIIHRSGVCPIVLFSALIDSSTAAVRVEMDSDIADMDGGLYESVG
ncbi:hypothetical protein K4L06_00925 [Lysobacter sp. BMK333-48F3]|uniref:hypothetical protein n=1 Tax=Lysobacter sp. BMK333-48F3 TaxID=2867962 RepID=UPI001C8B6DE3|nr:hypothetical protein [Lysobacter sp. BMK333-48F3]MBX9399856.1 hypothetical protein [Lysobacter sp. BMK333-48F3]